MREWRTLGLALASLLTFIVLVAQKASDAAIKEVTAACIYMVGALAFRSAVNALGNGTGVKGAVNALMTDAKPGEKAGG